MQPPPIRRPVVKNETMPPPPPPPPPRNFTAMMVMSSSSTSMMPPPPPPQNSTAMRSFSATSMMPPPPPPQNSTAMRSYSSTSMMPPPPPPPMRGPPPGRPYLSESRLQSQPPPSHVHSTMAPPPRPRHHHMLPKNVHSRSSNQPNTGKRPPSVDERDTRSKRIRTSDNCRTSEKSLAFPTNSSSSSSLVSSSSTSSQRNSSNAVPKKEHTDKEIIDLSIDDEGVALGYDEKAPSTSTHIIITIDFSSSMKKKDVLKNKSRISRWDAVFECMEVFLKDQIKDQQQQQHENDENNIILVSVIIFNMNAKTLLSHMPLVGDGQKVLTALEKARKMNKPEGGTGFSAGFKRAKEIATVSRKNENVVLVFLSDGRPGDLKLNPPKNPGEPMQDTFRSHGVTYPSAGQYIEEMKQLHGSRFSFHLICIYKEGRKWLDYLSKRYDGSLYEPDLNMGWDDDIESNDNNTERNNHTEDDDSDDDGVEIIEMIEKSNETLIREKFNRAKAAGQVVSIMNTTAANTTASTSMRSTFQTISSSVTAMRGGSNTRQLEERKGVVIMETSPMISYDATLMVLNEETEKFVVPSNETPNSRKVKVSLYPFAQGGIRNVYRMQMMNEKVPKVAKESRKHVLYRERLGFHIESAKCQTVATRYTKAFNKDMKKCESFTQHGLKKTPKIKMLKSSVIRLKDASSPGGYRYLAVEDEMKLKQGAKYEKWNSNNGYVNQNPSNLLQCQVAQAFSHFSYEKSDGQEMVVDIQGSGYIYTDPQVHSMSKEFGRADRGTSGFKDFFKTHKCNFICKGLNLKDRSCESVAVVKREE